VQLPPYHRGGVKALLFFFLDFFFGFVAAVVSLLGGGGGIANPSLSLLISTAAPLPGADMLPFVTTRKPTPEPAKPVQPHHSRLAGLCVCRTPWGQHVCEDDMTFTQQCMFLLSSASQGERGHGAGLVTCSSLKRGSASRPLQLLEQEVATPPGVGVVGWAQWQGALGLRPRTLAAPQLGCRVRALTPRTLSG